MQSVQGPRKPPLLHRPSPQAMPLHHMHSLSWSLVQESDQASQLQRRHAPGDPLA